MDNAQTDKLEPCPFCGGEIERIESWAKAFTPAKLFHEYNHPRGGTCFIGKRLLWSGEANGDGETRFLLKWNRRVPAHHEAEIAAAVEAERERCERVAGNYGGAQFGPRNDFTRGRQRGHDDAATAIRQQKDTRA